MVDEVTTYSMLLVPPVLIVCKVDTRLMETQIFNRALPPLSRQASLGESIVMLKRLIAERYLRNRVNGSPQFGKHRGTSRIVVEARLPGLEGREIGVPCVLIRVCHAPVDQLGELPHGLAALVFIGYCLRQPLVRVCASGGISRCRQEYESL